MSDDIETGASAAPTVDAEPSSPAPSESSAAPETPSRFAALMGEGDEDAGEDLADEASTDGDGTEEAEGEEPPAETEPEKKTEEADPLEDAEVPKDLKAVLKKFPDLRAAHFYKRDLDPLGISVEEAQAYREQIQSLDDLTLTVDRAKALDAFEGLFTHPDADGPEKFLDGLRELDPGNADRFIRTVAKSLPKLAPEAYYELGGQVWETGLAKLESIAAEDPFRREALAAVREMIDELATGRTAAPAAAAPAPLPNPDAQEPARRREQDTRGQAEQRQRLFAGGNEAADREVRALVADVVKRRDPDGLLTSEQVINEIVHGVHRTVAGNGAVQRLFIQALNDTSLPPEQRIAKAAGLIRARAKNVVDLEFRKRTDGIAERIRKASQLKLGKAAKVVSIREATGGRPATTSAPALPPGARPTARDIFRAVMKG